MITPIVPLSPGRLRTTFIVAVLAAPSSSPANPPAPPVKPAYLGLPFHDTRHSGVPEVIPVRVENEGYDVLDVSDARAVRRLPLGLLV
jgi:hypothetical protein